MLWRSAIATARSIFCPALVAALLMSMIAPSLASAQTPNNDINFLSGYYRVPYIIAVDDIYGTGSQEMLGTVNDGFGMLRTTIVPGLENIFPVRSNRDTRVADLNNDGLPDIISNTYSCVDPFNHPEDIARVFLNNGNGTFSEVADPFRDSSGHPIELRGRGETIVVADFNNDGYLDAFIPFYTFSPTEPAGCENSPQSYLLINDGTGHFTDIAKQAGVDLPNQFPPIEGAQAVDFNNDGWIDLYGAGHLFINLGPISNPISSNPSRFPANQNTFPRLNGSLSDSESHTQESPGSIKTGPIAFLDFGARFGLPLTVYDEGAKFVDWNNDGTLGLVVHVAEGADTGPSLYAFHNSVFTKVPGAFPADGLGYNCTFGMNAYDLNNDGLDDVIVREGLEAGTDGVCRGPDIPTRIFINQGNNATPRFQPSNTPFNPYILGNWGCPGGASAFGDFNEDGKIDVAFCGNESTVVATNITAVNNPHFVIEILGSRGQRNQQGRVVRASPLSHPGVIYTRVVDSGSGYLSQNQYPILIGTRYNEAHLVNISLPRRLPGRGIAQISFLMSPGQRARVFAPSFTEPNGRVQIDTIQPRSFSPALVHVITGLD